MNVVEFFPDPDGDPNKTWYTTIGGYKTFVNESFETMKNLLYKYIADSYAVSDQIARSRQDEMLTKLIDGVKHG